MSDINKMESELNDLRNQENALLEKISQCERERKYLHKSLWDKYKTINYPNTKTDNK
jgi:single-stranded DNA-specific DHH superfamily exonuclease